MRTLTDEDVRLIVELFDDLSISVKEIAEKFEVSPSLVEGITRREIYVDVTKRLKNLTELLEQSVAKNGEKPLTNKSLLNILKMLERQQRSDWMEEQ